MTSGDPDMRQADAQAHARAAASPSGIGAVLVERRTGGLVRCRVSDGRALRWVEVEDPAVAPAPRIEQDLEAFASSLPPAGRLARLEAGSPLPYPFA